LELPEVVVAKKKNNEAVSDGAILMPLPCASSFFRTDHISRKDKDLEDSCNEEISKRSCSYDAARHSTTS
jgi:hypothetical protein